MSHRQPAVSTGPAAARAAATPRHDAVDFGAASAGGRPPDASDLRPPDASDLPAGGAANNLPAASGLPALGAGAWVVLPTYNEADNLPGIAGAILEALPAATLLVVDDSSPDGTGDVADALAARDPRIRVLHRSSKEGLGRAYLDGFRLALGGGAELVVQMDADWSHEPGRLPDLVAPISAGAADLVIGSRYVRGGSVVDWGYGRKLISRGGSLFARTVLRLRQSDLTGGFKAWRASTLTEIPFDGIHAGGYVFQIEMTWLASRAGARVTELPIRFQDRRVGQSKMSRRIVIEALVVVLQLRLEQLIGRRAGRRRG
jgi:dolichol-phosphate mannosyltransferase